MDEGFTKMLSGWPKLQSLMWSQVFPWEIKKNNNPFKRKYTSEKRLAHTGTGYKIIFWNTGQHFFWKNVSFPILSDLLSFCNRLQEEL